MLSLCNNIVCTVQSQLSGPCLSETSIILTCLGPTNTLHACAEGMPSDLFRGVATAE